MAVLQGVGRTTLLFEKITEMLLQTQGCPDPSAPAMGWRLERHGHDGGGKHRGEAGGEARG